MLTYEEIKNYLKYHGKESNIYLPNDIFEELKVIENVQHRAFAYSYIYLTTWIWRNGKYGEVKPSELSQSNIMNLLGKKGNTRLRYITAKGGLLEEIKYLETSKDYPLYSSLTEEGLEFTYLSNYSNDSEVYEYLRPPSNFEAKRPIRGHHRNILDPEWKTEYENGYEDGTFFEIENTFEVPFEVFMYCMSNKNIGEKGFYIYSFLKMKNQMFNGYDVPMKGLAEQLKMPEKTAFTWLKTVRQYNMVQGIHNQDAFVVGLPKEQRKSNTYITNDIEHFTNKPIEYAKMTVVKRSVYLEKVKKEQEKREQEDIKKYGVTITLDQLPF